MIHRFLPLILVSFVMGLSACDRKSAEPKTAPRLTLHYTSEPVTLDPSQVEDGIGMRLIVNLMEGLTGFNNQGQLVLRSAESATVSADLKTYQYKLKNGLTWSDGVPVEADQFRLGIERALQPKSGAKLSGLLKWIEGADAFSKGEASTVSGITIRGPNITFKLVKPISFFDQVLAQPIAYPLRKDVLDANAGKWDPLRGKNVPTNGAYRIRSSTPDQELLLEAARRGPPLAPREVRIRIVTDDSTATTLFEEGQLDILSRIPALDQKRLEEKGVVRTVPFLATYFLGFNLKKKPFDKAENRRSVANGILKSELAHVIGTGEKPASSWIPESVEGFYPFRGDPERGVPAAKPRHEVVVAFDSTARNLIVLEKVQADLKANLGWKVRLKSSDWKPYVRTLYSDPEMIYRFGWSTPMRDPALFLLPFVTKDPFSFSHYSNPKYDRLVEEIVAMKPSKERETKIFEAQKIILEDDVVVVPLYHYVSSFAVGPFVQKFEMSPLVGITNFEEVELKAR